MDRLCLFYSPQHSWGIRFFIYESVDTKGEQQNDISLLYPMTKPRLNFRFYKRELRRGLVPDKAD